MELNVIVGNAVFATKLYHTSGDAALPQAAKPAVAVAFINVPEIFEHELPLVSEIAPAHKSFAPSGRHRACECGGNRWGLNTACKAAVFKLFSQSSITAQQCGGRITVALGLKNLIAGDRAKLGNVLSRP